MFKRFINVTAISAITALSALPAFSADLTNGVYNNPEVQTFLNDFKKQYATIKPIVLHHDIKQDSDENFLYSFAQQEQLEIKNELLDHPDITQEQKDFIKIVADTYNQVYAKGYYPNQAKINVHLINNTYYNYYKSPEILEQFKEAKEIKEHNDEIYKIVHEKEAALSEYLDKLEETKSSNNSMNIDDFNLENISEVNDLDNTNPTDFVANNDIEEDITEARDPIEEKLLDEIYEARKLLKPPPMTIGARETENIERNFHLFDKQYNPSGIFVIAKPQLRNYYKNYMLVSFPQNTKDNEQCYTVVSTDKNGDQASLIMGNIDPTAMLFNSQEEKEILNKFILLHELSHCSFMINENTKFKKINTNNPEVDQVLNDLFNPATENRYQNHFMKHFQEHYADTYAAIVLLREENNERNVMNVLKRIKDIRFTNTKVGDFEHFTSYALQQLEHPDIINKIKTLPINELEDFAMSLTQKSTALTLANSKEFQKHLTDQLSISFSKAILSTLYNATFNISPASNSYEQLGLGDKDNFTSNLLRNSYNKFNDILNKNPSLRNEMQIVLGQLLTNLPHGLIAPHALKQYQKSKSAEELMDVFINMSNEASGKVISKIGSFEKLGEKLKTSLENETSSMKISEIGDSYFANNFIQNYKFAPQDILPKDIYSHMNKFSIDEKSLKAKIEQVANEAGKNRDSYLNHNAHNIKIKKL